jgi:lysophospholipase L1-like esterase
MRPKTAILLAALAAVLLAIGLAPSASASSAPVYYVALGDSLATGAQPARSSLNAANGTNRGYVEVLHALKRDELGNLQLRNFACGGESTESMIEGPRDRFAQRCGYSNTSQLAEALAFLEEHEGEIAFVTIDIGAGDVLGGGGVAAIAQNLPLILDALRDALGPDVPIVGMNYYDPGVAPVWFQTQSLTTVQEQVDGTRAFNDFLEGIYQRFDAAVAEVEGAFSLTDLTIQPSGLPLNVQRACQWTWMCDVGDIHANDAGYAAIARAFLEVLH